MSVCERTFALQLFGVSEDESVQEADEGEVTQRVSRVFDGLSLGAKHRYRDNRESHDFRCQKLGFI